MRMLYWMYVFAAYCNPRCIVLTWMAFWNLDMLKPTHLMTNMLSLKDMERTMTKDDRKYFQKRFEKRNRKRQKPRTYHKKCVKKDGSAGWCGGKDLAKSAEYTKAFAEAVFFCWSAAIKAGVWDSFAMLCTVISQPAKTAGRCLKPSYSKY